MTDETCGAEPLPDLAALGADDTVSVPIVSERNDGHAECTLGFGPVLNAPYRRLFDYIEERVEPEVDRRRAPAGVREIGSLVLDGSGEVRSHSVRAAYRSALGHERHS